MLQQTSERMRFPRHPVLPTHNVLLRLLDRRGCSR